MSIPRSRQALAAAGATAVAVLGFAAPAMAQAPSSTVSIDDCHVQRSPTTGVTWFYCGVTADNANGARVAYKANVPTYKPRTAGAWSSRSGTLSFDGRGQELTTLKFAVRGRSVAQLRKSLRVTLSDARGATITDATARAAR